MFTTLSELATRYGLSSVDMALLAVSAVGTLLWWVAYGSTARSLRNVPRLSERQDPAPASWPSVSVIVPACNEAPHIGATLAGLLAQDYEPLQVVAVDDRSTDETGAIAAALARTDLRLRAVTIDTLPPGWLGKVNALRVGSDVASGDLLLFCDADIDYEPSLLRRAVALMEAEDLGLLTLFPHLRGDGFMHVVMSAFGDGYLQRTLGSRSVLAARGKYFGFGAFMLIRRSTLAATEGLAWLKLDVLDDLALAKLLNDSGARCGFAVADDLLSVQWYTTLWAFAHNTEKNFWGGMAGFSAARCLAMATAAAGVFTAPFYGVFAHLWLGITLLAAALVPVVINALAGRRLQGRTVAAGLLNPVAQWVLAAIMARAALVSIGRKRITWRGTTYDVAALRAGRRVSYP